MDIELSLQEPLGAAVGQELGVPLHAYARGLPVQWTWRSLTNPALAMRKRRPTLTSYSGGTAVWRWTPTAEDLGAQQMEFTASAADQRRPLLLNFTVTEGAEPPAFREPYGEGTTLDLSISPCVRVPVLVESTSAPRVTLSLQAAPPNATLQQREDLAGELVFCPSAAQYQDQRVYPLTLSAAAGPYTIYKIYVIVLRRSL